VKPTPAADDGSDGDTPGNTGTAPTRCDDPGNAAEPGDDDTPGAAAGAHIDMPWGFMATPGVPRSLPMPTDTFAVRATESAAFFAAMLCCRLSAADSGATADGIGDGDGVDAALPTAMGCGRLAVIAALAPATGARTPPAVDADADVDGDAVGKVAAAGAGDATAGLPGGASPAAAASRPCTVPSALPEAGATAALVAGAAPGGAAPAPAPPAPAPPADAPAPAAPGDDVTG
jgi:hypothetical protein